MAELLQLVPVNADAPVFHPAEHFAKRKLDIPVESRHSGFFQLLGQNRAQMPHGLGAGGSVLILYRASQIIGCQLGYRIVGLGGVQVVGCQLSVKDAFPVGGSILVQTVDGLLGIVENQALSGKGKALHGSFHGGQAENAVFKGDANAAVRGEIHRALPGFFRHGTHPGQGFLLRGFRLGHLCRRAPQAVLVNEPDEFQFLEQLVQLRTVVGLDDGIPGGKFNGSLRADGGKIKRKIGLVPVLFQLLPELRADGRVVQMVIDPVKAAEFRQQFLGGLGANAADAGNIVGGIAHQGLQVDEFFRLETVFGPEFFFVVQFSGGLAGLGDHQLHMDVFINELQRVPVAGDDDALPAAA